MKDLCSKLSGRLCARSESVFVFNFLLALFIFTLYPHSLKALSCSEIVTKAAAACITENGLQQARSCRAKAEVAGCGQQSQSNLDDSKCLLMNKQNVDWVFLDSGATQSFTRFRTSGLSPLEAVVAAQAHNPPVQHDLRLCSEWVEAYLAGRGLTSDPARKPTLTDADCRCISVLPQGGTRFGVSNSCSSLNVSVRFKDQMNSLLASWINVGSVSNGQTRDIIAPDYELDSISSIEIAKDGESLSCYYP